LGIQLWGDALDSPASPDTLKRELQPRREAALRWSSTFRLFGLPPPRVVCYKDPVILLDDALLQTVTERLVAEFRPEQIWLYGSHAWGKPHD